MIRRLCARTSLVWLLAACGGDDPGTAGIDARGSGFDAGASLVDARPLPPGATTLVVLVTEGDEAGPPLPAKVVLYDEGGQPLRIGHREMYDGSAQDRGYCDLGGGVVGTWDGIALLDGSGEIPIGDDFCLPAPAVPFGTYRVRVMHGIDFEMFETTVVLAPRQGRVIVRAPLTRAWTASGALAADLHVHADPSGDSNVPEWVRVITELVTGIQVIGVSDHNHNGSYDEAIDGLGLRGRIASLAGNEVTIDMVHANVFPAVIAPGQPRNGASSYEELRSLSARQLMDHMRALPGRPLVQLNHPRLRFAAFFDYAGWNGVTWPPPLPTDFDAIEVYTGWYMFNVPGDARLDEAIRDLHTFLSNGKLVTATGNSDTHHLNGILAGVPRNYVYADDTSLDPFDEDGFADAVRRRRVTITTGPWLEVRAGAGDGVGPGELVTAADGYVALTVVVKQASWVHASRVRVWVGGQVRETLAIPDGATTFEWRGDVAVSGPDTWIGVDAMGTRGLPLELSGDGHASVGGMLPAAMINPILVDADASGSWSVAAAPLPPEVDVFPPPWSGASAPMDCAPPEGNP